MRIVPHYGLLDSELASSPAQLAIIKNQLVPAAIEWLSRALHVRRVAGPLTLLQPCASYYELGDKCVQDEVTGLCSNRLCAQVIDPVRCGRFIVPAEHLSPQLVCGVGPDRQIPEDCIHVPGGAGIADADMVLYVGASDDAVCASDYGSGASVLAYASSCHREDEHDRPVSGYISMCRRAIREGGIRACMHV